MIIINSTSLKVFTDKEMQRIANQSRNPLINYKGVDTAGICDNCVKSCCKHAGNRDGSCTKDSGKCYLEQISAFEHIEHFKHVRK
jgi:hypothetical protein